MKKIKHKSIDQMRLRFCKREKAFSEMWGEQNIPNPGTNHGFGILQDLMVLEDRKIPTSRLRPKRLIFNITQREAVIVATVIQWLGTNVGMWFLDSALKKCGYKIVKI